VKACKPKQETRGQRLIKPKAEEGRELPNNTKSQRGRKHHIRAWVGEIHRIIKERTRGKGKEDARKKLNCPVGKKSEEKMFWKGKLLGKAA